VKSKDDPISGPKPFASSAARRIESIIEGAERAAERVIDDAEQQARAYIAEAEAEADRAVAERLASVGDLTDALVAQADAIRRQSELLTRSLREVKDRLEAGGGAGPAVSGAAPGSEPGPELAGAPESDSEARPPFLAAVEPDGEEEQANGGESGAERRGQGTPAGARLLATQMAVSGSSREEIAMRLRNGFEIEDAEAILDAILGPEG
jgi:vacuolar-type H+-ATPase subunit H